MSSIQVEEKHEQHFQRKSENISLLIYAKSTHYNKMCTNVRHSAQGMHTGRFSPFNKGEVFVEVIPLIKDHSSMI